jgi:hypothetical protein
MAIFIQYSTISGATGLCSLNCLQCRTVSKVMVDYENTELPLIPCTESRHTCCDFAVSFSTAQTGVDRFLTHATG